MRNLVGATVWMTASSVASLVLGFMLQVYLAFRFGAQPEMDAYIAASTLPALVISVIISGLSVVFIPVYVEYESSAGSEEAWRVVGSVLWLLLLLLTGVAGIGWLFTGQLVELIVPGFSPDMRDLSADLLYWLWPTIPLNTATTLLMSLHQVKHRFALTAVVAVIGAGSLFIFAVLFSTWLGMHGVVIASFASQVVQLVCLLAGLFQMGKFSFVPELRHPAVRSVLSLAAPLVLSSLIYRSTPLADRFVASLLPPGSLSHLAYGNRLALLLNTVFVSGLAATLFPAMARDAAERSYENLHHTLARGQRMVMLFLFPAIALLWALRAPFLEVLFERGEFTPQDTSAVAAIVPWYLLGVVGGALGTLQGRVYYVLKDTRTPAVLGLIEFGAYLFYLPWFAQVFGVIGVAIANMVFLNMALLISAIVVFRKLRVRGWDELLRAALRLAVAATAAGFGAHSLGALLEVNSLFALFAGSLAGAAIYIGVLYASRAPELIWLGVAIQSSPVGPRCQWLLKPLFFPSRSDHDH